MTILVDVECAGNFATLCGISLRSAMPVCVLQFSYCVTNESANACISIIERELKAATHIHVHVHMHTHTHTHTKGVACPKL